MPMTSTPPRLSARTTKNSAGLRRAIAVAAIVLATGTAIAADPISLRQDGMNGNKDAMKLIKTSLDNGGPYNDAAAAAGKIAAFAKTIPALFPPGSDVGAKNSAGPAIWTDPAGFAAAAAKAADAATALQQAALAGDKASIQAKFGALGAACKGCHEKYEKE